MNYDALFSTGLSPLQKSSLGGVQNDIFFSVMKVIHRQNVPFRTTASSDKVARLSCCCRISELMPLVRQAHDEARARAMARMADNDAQQAA
jgi:hypothetical protein